MSVQHAVPVVMSNSKQSTGRQGRSADRPLDHMDEVDGNGKRRRIMQLDGEHDATDTQGSGEVCTDGSA